MEKPINLIMEEAKVDYIDAINEITKKHNLPMYLVDIIVGAIYQEINNVRNQELMQEKLNYEKSLQEKKDTKK